MYLLHRHSRRTYTRPGTASVTSNTSKRYIYSTPSVLSSDTRDSATALLFFDPTQCWGKVHAELSECAGAANKDETTGFAGLPVLHSSDWLHFAGRANDEMEVLLAEVLSSSSATPSEIIFALDKISDTLCMVADSGAFCQSVHTDPAMVNSAARAGAMMHGIINKLNVSKELYAISCQVANDKNSITPEEFVVISKLKAEFEHQGVHLPTEKTQELLDLKENLHELEQEYQNAVLTSPSVIILTPEEAKKLPPNLQRKVFPVGSSKVAIKLTGNTAASILYHSPYESLRKAVYTALYSPAEEDYMLILEGLLENRRKMAHLLGFPSYFHMYNYNRVASNPKEVAQFLEQLYQNTIPKADKEIEMLRGIKELMCKHHGITDSTHVIHSWDYSYVESAVVNEFQKLASASTLAEYFPLANVLEGLRIVSNALFGVDLKVVPLGEHEGWAPKVIKIRVIDSDGSTCLGHVYMDLFWRQGKYRGDANFPLRLRSVHSGREATIGFVCNITEGSPTLVPFQDAENIFHEFGHALHSLFSDTQFQHASGTRSPMDFVECPSQLMESFFWDYRILSTFAKHYKTGEVLPYDYFVERKSAEGLFKALEVQDQICKAGMDLAFHGLGDEFGGNALQELRVANLLNTSSELYSRFNPQIHSKSWNGKFTHLVGYGSYYYSYLYSKQYSINIWDKLFDGQPLSREQGQKYREKMLAFGGTKNPHDMMLDLVGTKDLQLKELEY